MRPSQKATFNIGQFFSSFLAIALSAMYFFWRSQTPEKQIPLIIDTLGLSLFLICFPDLLFVLGKFFKKREENHAAYVLFFSLLIVIITGAISEIFNVSFIGFFTLIGFISFGFTLFLFIKNNKILSILSLLIIFFLFSLWLASVAWGLGFHTPLFSEGIVTENIHLDSLLNSAISQMIKTYGIPSTGLDGTPYMFYHWGSNWIFAQFSSIIGINPLLFYQLGYQVIFIPLFFDIFFIFIFKMREYFHIDKHLDYLFWTVLFLGFVGFFPISIVGILDRVLFFSESYLLSVSFAMLFFTILLTFLTKRKIVLTFLSLPFFIFTTSLLKISTGILMLSLIFYLILRLKIFTQTMKIFLCGVSFFCFYAAFVLVNAKYYGSTGSISLFYFLKNNVADHWKQFYLLTNYYLFYIFSFLRFRQENVGNIGELWKKITERKFIDVEALFILCLLGIIPGNVMKIEAGAAIYFSDLGRWVSLALLLAYLPSFFPNLNIFKTDVKKINFGHIKVNIIFIIIIFFPFFFSFITDNYKISILNLFHRNRIIISEYHSSNKRDRALIEKKKQLISTLEHLYSLNLAEKQKTLLYIPLSNYDYWHFSDCLTTPFIAPSLTGIAMLNGYPPHVCRVDAFGYEGYQKEKSAVDKAPLKTQALCTKTIKLGFSKIIIIRSNRSEDMETIKCK